MVLRITEDRIQHHIILDNNQVLLLSLPKWNLDQLGCSQMAQMLMELLVSMTEMVRRYILIQVILMMLVLNKQRLEDVQLLEIFLKFICI